MGDNSSPLLSKSPASEGSSGDGHTVIAPVFVVDKSDGSAGGSIASGGHTGSDSCSHTGTAVEGPATVASPLAAGLAVAHLTRIPICDLKFQHALGAGAFGTVVR